MIALLVASLVAQAQAQAQPTPQVTPPPGIRGECAKRGGGLSLVADNRHHVNGRIDRRLPSTDAWRS